MLEILKFLAEKVSGTATLGMTAMILTYMSCTAVVINSLFFCVGTIIFLYVSYLVGQVYLERYKNKD
jgi:hypothetical protein